MHTATLGLLPLLFALALAADSGTHQVHVGETVLAFTPSAITVTAGDTVHFVFDGYHSILQSHPDDPCKPASNPLINVGPAADGEWKIKFDNPGVYRYYCAIGKHCQDGMRGVVNVVAPGSTAAPDASVAGFSGGGAPGSGSGSSGSGSSAGSGAGSGSGSGTTTASASSGAAGSASPSPSSSSDPATASVGNMTTNGGGINGTLGGGINGTLGGVNTTGRTNVTRNTTSGASSHDAHAHGMLAATATTAAALIAAWLL